MNIHEQNNELVMNQSSFTAEKLNLVQNDIKLLPGAIHYIPATLYI